MVDEARLGTLLRKQEIDHRGQRLNFEHRSMGKHGYRYVARVAPGTELLVAVRTKKSPYVMLWWRTDSTTADQVAGVQSEVSALTPDTYEIADDHDEKGVRLVLLDGYSTRKDAVERTAAQLVACAEQLLAAVTLVAPELLGLERLDAFESRRRSKPDQLRQSDDQPAPPHPSDQLKEASAEHQQLVIDFWDELEELGRQPGVGLRGSVEFDLAWVEDGDRWVGEVKSVSSDAKNEADQIRKAIGQLVDYAEAVGEGTKMAVLLRTSPDERWVRICRSVGIEIRTIESDS